jgi:hypothetical protein
VSTHRQTDTVNQSVRDLNWSQMMMLMTTMELNCMFAAR